MSCPCCVIRRFLANTTTGGAASAYTTCQQSAPGKGAPEFARCNDLQERPKQLLQQGIILDQIQCRCIRHEACRRVGEARQLL